MFGSVRRKYPVNSCTAVRAFAFHCGSSVLHFCLFCVFYIYFLATLNTICFGHNFTSSAYEERGIKILLISKRKCQVTDVSPFLFCISRHSPARPTCRSRMSHPGCLDLLQWDKWPFHRSLQFFALWVNSPPLRKVSHTSQLPRGRVVSAP